MKEKIKLLIVFILGIIISTVISVYAATVITAGEVSYTSNSNTTVQTGLDNLYTKANSLASRVTTLESKITYKDFDYTISTSNAVQKYYYATINISQTGKTPIAWSVIWHGGSKPTIVRGGDSTSSPTQLKIFVNMDEWNASYPSGRIRVVYITN